MRTSSGSAIGPIDQLLATWHSPKSPEVRDRVQQGFELQSRASADVAELQRFPSQMRVLGSGGHSKLPGMRPPWVDDSLFPFESRFVELGDHVVHYVDEGSGPVLLMLNGIQPGPGISSLRGHFRSIALDYPVLACPWPGRIFVICLPTMRR